MSDYEATSEASAWHLLPAWAGAGDEPDTLLVRLRQSPGREALGSLQQRLVLARDLAATIARRHAAGTIHGDLSPYTLTCTRASLTLRDAPVLAPAKPPPGTPLYVAPEVAAGAAVDAVAESYALAATIAHLLRLQPPFELPVEPEAFWAAKRDGPVPAWGDLPPLPDEVRSALLAGLMVERSLRADAARILGALDTALAHADDIALRESVRLRLERQHAGIEQDLDGILADLAIIQANYPGDQRCQNLVTEARAAQARRAVAAGHVSRLRHLVADAKPEDQPATRLLIAAATNNHRRKTARRFAGWTAALLLALGLITVAGIWALRPTTPPPLWTPAWERTFTASGTLLAGLGESHHSWPGLRPIEMPSDDGLALREGRLLWITDAREGGDVRVTAEAAWIDRVDGFEILVHADDQPPPQWWMMPRSIGCQFGGQRGLLHLLSPNRVAGPPSPLTSAACDLMPGRMYRLALELHADTVRLLIDGREILCRRIGIPIAGAGLNRIGLRAWSDMRLRRLAVERLAPSDRISPVAIGDALLAHGDAAAALASWQRTAIDTFGSTVSGIAAARGFLLSCAHPGLPPGRAWFLDRLVLDHADTPMLADCHAAEAVLLWTSGNYQAAIAIASGLIARDPANIVALEILAGTQRPLPSEQAYRLLELIAQRPETPALDLRNLGLTDIAPLRGLRTRILNLAGNRITDLSPLTGMPLADLDLSGNPARDLTALAGNPQLRRLRLRDTAIASIAPLQGLPIDELDLSGTAVPDLAKLAGMPLQRLIIDDCPISDLAPLRGAPLRSLSANRCAISNLSPLSGGSLLQLYASGNAITDLRPLTGMLIRRLDLSLNQLTDLTPLAGMPIHELQLTGNRITDIRPLSGMPLRDCALSDNAITDLGPLTAMPDGTSRSLVLDSLNLNGNPLVAIDALGSVQTATLSLVECGLRRIPPGQHASLDLSLNPLDDVTELDLAPGRFYAAGSRLDPALVRTLADTWERKQTDPALVRHLRAQAAVLAGDVQTLRGLATQAGGQHLIGVATQVSLAQAQRLAAQLDAHLPRIEDHATEQAMIRETTPLVAAWLGLQHGPEGWTWHNGSRTMAKPLPTMTAGAWHFYVVQGMSGWGATPASQLDTARAGLVLAW